MSGRDDFYVDKGLDVQRNPYEPLSRPTISLASPPPVVVHHFTGAPRNESKNFPCGAMLTYQGRPVDISLTPPVDVVYRLAAVEACTDINEVTCLGCLRSLIAKGK